MGGGEGTAAALRRRAGRLGAPFTATRDALADPALRRLQLGWAGSTTGEYISVVAFGVVAYEAGGAAAVGLVGVVQMLPAALLNPVVALLGDRYRREGVVVVSDLLRAAAMLGAAGAVAVDAPVTVLYVLAAVLAVAGGALYPAQMALVPLLARSAGDVTAATAASNLVRNSASLAAPASAGVLLMVSSPVALFAVGAAAFALGALVVRAMPPTNGVRLAPAMTGAWRALTEGFRAAASDRGTALVMGLLAAHSTARGALGVLLVVVPLELLGLGASGVGFLNATVGVGAFVGAVAVTGLAGRRCLAAPMGGGLLLTGGSLVVAATLSLTPVVLAAMAVMGVGFALVGITGSTLLVRSARDDVLARVLGVLGTVRAGGMALGAGLTPVLLGLVGVRWTMAAVGAAVVAVSLAGRSGLRAIDDASALPERQLRLLQNSPVFAALLPMALERLARRMEPLEVTPGMPVLREGEVGDAVLIVAQGELAVETAAEGEVDRVLSGEVCGEMALLHDAPRNATVRALTECSLYRLTRDEFLAAVTGHPESAQRAQALVEERLAHRRRVAGER